MSPLQSTESKKLWKATKEEEILKLGFSIHSGHIAKEMWPEREREKVQKENYSFITNTMDTTLSQVVL